MAAAVPSGVATPSTRWDAAGVTALVVTVLWCAAWWRLVTLPENALVGDLLVDDAYYFALPARHVWEGAGFSFDGIEPTNGVQVLWAIVCVGIAGLIGDPILLLRALAGLSALAWLTASLGLYRWFGAPARAAATVAMSGLACSGLSGRLAFQGMENGLHALLGVAVLVAGTRAVRAGWRPGATWALGWWLALFALSRTEGALLGPFVAGVAVCGPAAGGSAADRWRRVARLAVPGLALVGGVAVASRVAFGAWLPISGSVKTFYEGAWGGFADPALPSGGGALASIAWHLELLWKLATEPLLVELPRLLRDSIGVAGAVPRALCWSLIVLGAGCALWRRRRHGDRPRARTGRAFAAGFVGYAFVHAVLIALLLPHFTQYATWYFASEITAVWLSIGLALAGLGRRFRPLLLGIAVLIALAGVRGGGGVAAHASVNRFHAAGMWLDAHAGPGAVVGALSAGRVGYFAPRAHVVNLDGLVNDRRYLDGFLRTGRLGEYFAERGIEWFADLAPRASWQAGVSWSGGNVPASRLAPRRYWRMPDGSAYGIWRVLAPDVAFELLGPQGPPARDLAVELAVAADVHGRFPVVGAAGLSAYPDRVVALSIPHGAPLELRHVLTTPDELASLGLSAATVWPEYRHELEVAPGLMVLGHDLAEVRTGARRQVAVTLYWRRERELGDTAIQLEVAAAGRRASARAGDCHGTLPASRWPLGRVVVETLLVEIDDASGEALRVGVAVLPAATRWLVR